MVRVDVHCHIYPKLYLDFLDSVGRLTKDKQTGITLINETGDAHGLKFPVFEEKWNMQSRLKSMEKLGIDIEILSIGNPWANYAPRGKSKELARMLNVELATTTKENPRKLVGMGVIPMENMEEAVSEIDFATEELGFRAFMIGSHVSGKSVGSKEFLPLFEEAVKKDVVVFVHPLAPPNVSEYYDLSATTSLIFPSETSTAALGIAMNGHFDRFPHAKIILAHLGGTIPYCLGRLDRATQTIGEVKLSSEASEYMRKFFLDTVSYFGPTFEYTTDLWGSEKILLGSDYPYAWGDNYDRLIRFIEMSKYSTREKMLILGENAVRLFRLNS